MNNEVFGTEFLASNFVDLLDVIMSGSVNVEELSESDTVILVKFEEETLVLNSFGLDCFEELCTVQHCSCQRLKTLEQNCVEVIEVILVEQQVLFGLLDTDADELVSDENFLFAATHLVKLVSKYKFSLSSEHRVLDQEVVE